MKNLLKYGLLAFLTWANVFVAADGLPFDIEYSVYMKDKGWGEWEQNGATAGKWDERLEALRIRIVNRDESAQVANCSIHYRAHAPGLGWLNWVKDGDIAGKVEDYPELQNESRRIEAVEVKLENCTGWDVSYRVHIINNGWTEAHNGGVIAGTIGESKTLVAFKMVLLPEGCHETWQPSVPKSFGYGEALHSIAWSEQRNRYVTAGDSVYTSLDGINWEQSHTNAIYTHYSQVTWGGDRWIRVISHSDIYWSYDGLDWSKLKFDFPGVFYGVYWNNGVWVLMNAIGGVVTSLDGINWQPQSLDLAARYSLVSNGKFWIGYPQSSVDPNKIIYSDNGIDWSSYNLEMDSNQIFWDGKQWILISLKNGVYSSNDGKSWQFQSNARPYNSTAIASNGETSISVGYNGSIFTSQDSYNWTQAPPPVSEHLYDVTWNNGQWIAVGAKGAIIVSDDGLNWHDKTSGNPNTRYINDVAGTSDYWIISAGLQGIYRSTDGVDWQEQFRKPGLSVYAVKWNGEHWLAMAIQYQYTIFGEVDSSTPKTTVILSSGDGITWTSRLSKVDDTFSEMEWDGEDWVVMGTKSTIRLNSEATQWQEAVHTEVESFRDIKWNGNDWIAIGQAANHIYHSNDAINWVLASDFGPNLEPDYELRWHFYDVEWNGSEWVIVGSDQDTSNFGEKGMIWTSSDGLKWQPQYIPDTGRLISIANNGTLWVAAGYGLNTGSSIFTSEDGLQWEKQNLPITFGPINAVQWNGYQWLAITDLYEGELFTSSDGMSWQEQIESDWGYKKMAWNGNQWLIVPKSDEQLYVNQCSNNDEQNSCAIESAHYEESTGMMHIDQLLVQGAFGTHQAVNDVSFKYVPNSIPIAFENNYLDTPENSLLCAEEPAILNLDGQLNIPSFKYTPQIGSEKVFQDVIFQIDESSNKLNFQSSLESK